MTATYRTFLLWHWSQRCCSDKLQHQHSCWLYMSGWFNEAHISFPLTSSLPHRRGLTDTSRPRLHTSSPAQSDAHCRCASTSWLTEPQRAGGEPLRMCTGTIILYYRDFFHQCDDFTVEIMSCNISSCNFMTHDVKSLDLILIKSQVSHN